MTGTRKNDPANATPERRRMTPRSQRDIVPMPEAAENASGTHVPERLVEGGTPAGRRPRSLASERRRTRTRGT